MDSCFSSARYSKLSLDLSFIWGHHHLQLVGLWMISRPANYFITCYTVLTRPNKVETAVHGCNSWLSVWALSCLGPVKLSTKYQPCIIVCYSSIFDWSDLLQILRKQAAFSFAVQRCIIMLLGKNHAIRSSHMRRCRRFSERVGPRITLLESLPRKQSPSSFSRRDRL